MPNSAVGMFADVNAAEAVVDTLRAHGFPAKGIQMVTKPEHFPMTGPTSSPSIDFVAALSRDLRGMGASDSEREVYLDGVRSGKAMVLATGTPGQADAAVEIMNEYSPLIVEELAAAAPMMPGVHRGEIGLHDPSSKAEKARALSAGARMFSW